MDTRVCCTHELLAAVRDLHRTKPTTVSILGRGRTTETPLRSHCPLGQGESLCIWGGVGCLIPVGDRTPMHIWAALTKAEKKRMWSWGRAALRGSEGS